MRLKKRAMMLAFATVLSLAFASMGRADDFIIVCSDATWNASQNWIGFLKVNEVPLKFVKPSEFQKYKEERFIAILGGVDEPDGIKDIAKEVLSNEEFQWVSRKDNGKMYLKSNVWGPGQNVILFVGSDQKAAERARTSSKDEWLGKLSKWFDIQEGTSFHTY